MLAYHRAKEEEGKGKKCVPRKNPINQRRNQQHHNQTPSRRLPERVIEKRVTQQWPLSHPLPVPIFRGRIERGGRAKVVGQIIVLVLVLEVGWREGGVGVRDGVVFYDWEHWVVVRRGRRARGPVGGERGGGEVGHSYEIWMKWEGCQRVKCGSRLGILGLSRRLVQRYRFKQKIGPGKML